MPGSLAMEARHTEILTFLGRSQYYRTTISGVRLTARECKRCICLWSKGVVSWNYPKCASEGTASENGKQLITSWISLSTTDSQPTPKVIQNDILKSLRRVNLLETNDPASIWRMPMTLGLALYSLNDHWRPWWDRWKHGENMIKHEGRHRWISSAARSC